MLETCHTSYLTFRRISLDLQLAPLDSTVNRGTVSATTLREPLLTLVRVSGGALMLTAVGLFIFAIPARYDQLLHLPPQVEVTLLRLQLSLNGYALYALTLEIILMLALSLSAALIFWYRSDDWLALFTAVTLVTWGVFVTPAVDALMLIDPFWRFPGNLVQAIGLGFALLFAYLFPDGRFVPGWCRWLALILVGWMGIWILFPGTAFIHPSDPYSNPISWLLVVLGWGVTGVLVQVYRYTHVSGPVQRQQIKWHLFSLGIVGLGYAILVIPPTILPTFGPFDVSLYYLLGQPLYMLDLLIVPLAVIFAVLQYRLWDIDLLLSRLAVYSILILVLALVYLIVEALLQSWFLSWTGVESQLAVMIATLATAVMFGPLRRLLLGALENRLYQRKYDTSQTLAVFDARLRNEVDLERLTDALLTVVEETVQPETVSLWLRSPGSRRAEANDNQHDAPS